MLERAKGWNWRQNAVAKGRFYWNFLRRDYNQLELSIFHILEYYLAR